MDASARVRRKSTARRRLDTGPWGRARRAVQYLALAAFIWLFLWSRQGGGPGNTINIPMRLDPLLILTHALAARQLLAGSALALIILVGTLIFGRAWCGWLCPLGTTLDLIGPHAANPRLAPPAEAWRRLKHLLFLLTLAAALFGNLTLLVLDPLTIMLRTLSVSVWPAADQFVTFSESLLYRVPALANPVTAVDAWLRPAVFPETAIYYRDALLFAVIFIGIVALEAWVPRFWCRYVCPLGGLLGLLSKPALFRRRLTMECKGCTLCTDLCPTGTIDAAKGYASDAGECTMCMDCLATCPRNLTTFAPRLPRVTWETYDPNRRDALVAIGTALAAVALYRSSGSRTDASPALVRPPGVQDTNADVVAFTKCTRCSECIRVCPTAGLQPSVGEAGMAGFGTPILIPRMGYCDYSCNACGQACPVQAIPPLSLDEKRVAIIGKAYIHEDRCLAWSDHTPCIVCQEMCPLPSKAIELEDARVWGPNQTQIDIQLPHVLRDLCIGCGICEYQCPVAGEAAIRIYSVA